MSAPDEELACPCEAVEHPRAIANPPGRNTLARRVGDFTSFRRALLVGRPGEEALAAWRPGADGDLAVQMVEWFAYLADVLTFYDERIANESYLGTAVLPESVRGLVATLGYRPRPGIGAEGIVAGLLSGTAAVTLPAGFALQSKPGPGQQPQTFELDAQTTIGPPATVNADPPADESLAGRTDLLVAGSVTSVKANDLLLLLPVDWSGGGGWAALRVTSLGTEKDPRGAAMTRISFGLESDPLPDDATTGGYRLLRPTQMSHPWLYLPGVEAVTTTSAHLDSTARRLRPGDPVLFEIPATGFIDIDIPDTLPGSGGPFGDSGHSSRNTYVPAHAEPVKVSSYSETIWYADGDPSEPETAPSSAGIAILHSVIAYSENAALEDVDVATTTIHHGFVEVAPLRGEPAVALTADATTLHAPAGAAFPIGQEQRVLVEDAAGAGAAGWLSSEDGGIATLRWEEGAVFTLVAPLRVHMRLLEVSRGQTVAGEVLGSGDPTRANQEFILKKSPLTYLSSTDPGDPGYRSTLTVYVSGIAWTEAQSFYGLEAHDRVFVLSEDDDQVTHVRFGDGIHGARLPAGTNNVVATYRYGSGGSVPAAGALTNVLKPVGGLLGVRSPVPAAGGADPETAASLGTYAPRSVLTFGRAVSADDYGALAAQAPGVTRVRADFAWDAQRQRSLVKIYVGDDAGAVAAARSWLRAYADPNRIPIVEAAQPIPVTLSLTVRVTPGYDPGTVGEAVRAALLDQQVGMFAPSVRQIGALLFDSQIYAACLAVEGAAAVHGLLFDDGTGRPGSRHDPGANGFYVVLEEGLTVTAEMSPDG